MHETRRNVVANYQRPRWELPRAWRATPTGNTSTLADDDNNKNKNNNP